MEEGYEKRKIDLESETSRVVNKQATTTNNNVSSCFWPGTSVPSIQDKSSQVVSTVGEDKRDDAAEDVCVNLSSLLLKESESDVSLFLDAPVNSDNLLSILRYMQSLPKSNQTDRFMRSMVAMYYQAAVSSVFSASYDTLHPLLDRVKPILECHHVLPKYAEMIHFFDSPHSAVSELTLMKDSNNNSIFLKNNSAIVDMNGFSIVSLQQTPMLTVVKAEFDMAFKEKVLSKARISEVQFNELVQTKRALIHGLYYHLYQLLFLQGGDEVAVDERRVIHQVQLLFTQHLLREVPGVVANYVEKFPEAEVSSFNCQSWCEVPTTAPEESNQSNKAGNKPRAAALKTVKVQGHSDLTVGHVPHLIELYRTKYKGMTRIPYDDRLELQQKLESIPNDEMLHREFKVIELVTAEKQLEKIKKEKKSQEQIRDLHDAEVEVARRTEELRMHRLKFTHCLYEMKSVELRKKRIRNKDHVAFSSSTLGRSARDQTIAQLIALQQAKGRGKPAVMAILSDFVTLSVLMLRGNNNNSSSSSSGDPAVVTGEGMRILKLGRVKKEEDVVLAELAVLCMQPADLISEVEALYERCHGEKLVETVAKLDGQEGQGDEGREEQQQGGRPAAGGGGGGLPPAGGYDEDHYGDEHEEEVDSLHYAGSAASSDDIDDNAETGETGASMKADGNGLPNDWVTVLQRAWAAVQNRPDPYDMYEAEREEDDSVSDISQVSSDTETRQKKRQRQKRNRGGGCGNADEHDSDIFYDSERSEDYEEECAPTLSPPPARMGRF